MHKKSVVTVMLVLCLAACTVSAPMRRLDDAPLSIASVNRVVAELMQTNQVPGLAVALIQDGRISFVNAYGKRDVEHNLPLTTDTIMYGASLTKASFAYLVMQLVDEGLIDLDRPIGAYLPKPLPDYPQYSDLANDPRWQRLTMRILLDHTTGFQNFRWIDPDKRLRFHRDPGERYGYSGEGINLAQFILETGLGLDLGAEMQRRVFDRFGMTRTAMRWRADFAGNVAQGYTAAGALQEHEQRQRVRAAGSMDTTIADWAKFLAGVSRGEGLSAKSKAEMTHLQISIDSESQFPTLQAARTDRWQPIALGYGIGWGVFDTPYGHAYFKEGHDDGTANYALCVDSKRTCILLMSNSVRAEGIFVTLVNRLMGNVNLPWSWQGYAPDTASAAKH